MKIEGRTTSLKIVYTVFDKKYERKTDGRTYKCYQFNTYTHAHAHIC